VEYRMPNPCVGRSWHRGEMKEMARRKDCYREDRRGDRKRERTNKNRYKRATLPLHNHTSRSQTATHVEDGRKEKPQRMVALLYEKGRRQQRKEIYYKKVPLKGYARNTNLVRNRSIREKSVKNLRWECCC